MYREGHAGLSFLIFSPFLYLFRLLGFDLTNVLVTGLLMAGLSSLPDIDIRWEIKHRGVTHTLLFGIFVGIIFSVLLGYVYGSVGWFMGFTAGFGGIASHLVGDAFTYSPFKPFYPFSNREAAYGFFKSSNQTVNRVIFVLGVIAFTISYEPTIITQFFH